MGADGIATAETRPPIQSDRIETAIVSARTRRGWEGDSLRARCGAVQPSTEEELEMLHQESLESRRMLSVTVSLDPKSGQLSVVGNKAPDDIRVEVGSASSAGSPLGSAPAITRALSLSSATGPKPTLAASSPRVRVFDGGKLVFDSATFSRTSIRSVSVDAGAGDDTVDVAMGGAQLPISVQGGEDHDTITLTADAVATSSNGSRPIALVASGGAGDDVLNGSARGDQLNGDDGNDQIFGNDGPDTINGGAGDDGLFAGDGDDFIDHGGGTDAIDGGDGFDRAVVGKEDKVINVEEFVG
jgi:Ca2+-binding RTX toxin-like protein